MVIPMGAIPSQDGEGSAYAKSWESSLKIVLVVQSLCCLLRITALLDIMGGFINAIYIGLGWWGVKNGMQIQWLCYYGMMGAVYAIFDLVKFIDSSVHGVGLALVSPTSPSAIFYDIVGLSVLAGPLAMVS